MTVVPKACVIGWPIHHSRSPLIHQFWLKQYRLDGVYTREAVEPRVFADFLNNMATNGYCGANVTLPHKEQALQLCDKTSELARRIGAVNTLWFNDGRLFGDNSDVSGFLDNLDEQTPGWDAQCERAVIVGAGGAARAILAGLQARKIGSATLLNRSVARARHLAEEATDWGDARINAEPLDSVGQRLAGAGLVINTTSLGMSGQPELDLELGELPDHAVVCDIVYVPLETGLLKAARRRGLRTCSGLGMLLHQAAPGFRHWYGVRPEVTKELRALIEADIERGSA